MTKTANLLVEVEALFAAARRQDLVTLQIRVGEDLRAAFEAQAGALLTAGAYKGVPVSFDAIDPAAILTETEPA
ncbi:hypothetical protein [Caulobacter sp. FWC26]|uniref:hypothetical protein n=1 Tax=Caulobacter sp. FWC26 TaxID=69665 RepID=UPI000C1613FB|nr:hypothetical protein [Caulobacter sp. FWC26]AZS19404.1 hypothetical protein CSW63_01385 [Caulobacter sp. FWC26]